MLGWLVAGLVAVMVFPRDLSELWSVFLSLFLLPMFCGYMGSRILSADVSDEQLPFILTLPMSRSQLWTARASAGLLVTLSTAVLTMIPVTVLGINRSSGRVNWDMVAGFTLACLLVYSVAAFLALLCDRPLTAAFSAFTVSVLGCISHTVVMGKMRLYYLHIPETTYWAYMALWSVLLLVASWRVFTGADLLERSSRRRWAFGVGVVVLTLAVSVFSCFLAYMISVTPRPSYW